MPTTTAFPSDSRGAARGFTLTELMVAATLSGLVVAGVLTTALQLMRSGVRITQYAEMSTQIRRGLEQLGHDLKIASAVKWNSASDLTLTLPTTGGSTTQVTYAWTSTTQALFQVPGADSTVTAGRVYLVRGIPAGAGGSAGVTFARYDRDGNAATTDLATKRVQVILNVARTTARSAAATDTAVSALFILRNKPTS
ncbi:MAG TPA: prepilin-type N-terminal cleavage/methylation domain-containing protein [Opitutaceae bacterium]|nr:prepilin-type N-terminal cleavage/methylation domain-containing protein [Opitutaceae bacterium]